MGAMRKFIALVALPFCLAAALPCTAADRDALRKIVQEQCLIHWQSEHTPAPCVNVEAGSAVLLDRKGGAHFLLIATRTVGGIESPEAIETGAPNYFAQAWAARGQLDGIVGHAIRRDAVGLATNPISARSRISCTFTSNAYAPSCNRSYGKRRRTLPPAGRPYHSRD